MTKPDKKVLVKPVEPPKQKHCSECHLTDEYLQQRRNTFECSRVSCPKRTASGPLRDWGVP